MSPTVLPRRRSAAGFTLVEMAISLFILVIVIVGVLGLFDLASRISRVQIDVAGMQESVRSGQYDMIRMVRMAGRGGVPIQAGPSYLLPNGNAISITNNVGAGVFMDAGTDTKRVLEGTDVLTIRGAFSSPAYALSESSFSFAGNNGQFRLDYYAKPNLPVPQTLQPLADAILRSRVNGKPEAMILVSPLDERWYHIVEVDAVNSVITNGDPDGGGPLPSQPVSILVFFQVTPSPPANVSPASDYWRLSGNDWDSPLTQGGVATAALLEEYRYYVLDDDRETPGDTSTPPHPRLVRARVYPGSQVPYDDDTTNWAVPIADNVADLQVSFGIETGAGSAFVPEEGPVKKDDEWLFNDPLDNVADLRWSSGASRLAYVRLTTTAYSERRDRQFRVPQPAVTTEDHVYTIWDPAARPAKPLTPDQSYRRRSLRTVVDLRNLS